MAKAKTKMISIVDCDKRNCGGYCIRQGDGFKCIKCGEAVSLADAIMRHRHRRVRA